MAYRFYRLIKNEIAFGVFFITSVTVFAILLGAGIVGIKHSLSLNQMYADSSHFALVLTVAHRVFHQSDSIFESLFLVWLGLQTFLEAGLAGMLCNWFIPCLVHLPRSQNKVGVGYALLHCKPPFIPSLRKSFLARVFRGFVQSGGAVFLFSFADFITYVTDRTTTVYVMFSLSINYSFIFDCMFSHCG